VTDAMLDTFLLIGKDKTIDVHLVSIFNLFQFMSATHSVAGLFVLM
jgi:hypothetical protein